MGDPFTTLGLEPRFDIDAASLEARHRDLKKALHPDRYVDKGASERRMALTRALEVGEAFRALRNPLKRAEILASSLGLDVSETSKEKASPDLLFEMMESREELASTSRAADRAPFEALASRMAAREKGVIEKLGAVFARASSGDGAARSEVVPLLHELRYLRRFNEEAEALAEAAADTVA